MTTVLNIRKQEELPGLTRGKGNELQSPVDTDHHIVSRDILKTNPPLTGKGEFFLYSTIY